MSDQNAITLTKELVKVLADIDNIYEKTRETKEEYDFYSVVEPYANHVYDLAKKWRIAINEVISSRKTYFYGEKHVDQVVENVSILSAQAFQHTTSYKRFKSYVQSTKFLLTTIERQL